MLKLLLLYPISYQGTTAKSFRQVATPQALFLPIVREGIAITPTQVTDGRASWSTPIDISSLDQSIWTVNPDSGSVTVIDSSRLTRIAEISVGQEPWALTIAPDGQHVYIADRATGQLIVVDALNYIVTRTLAVGYELGGIALSPSGAHAYVSSMATDEVVVIDTQTQQVARRIAVDYMPFAVTVTDDGDNEDNDEQIYVSHLFARQIPGGIEASDDGRVGQITVIDLATSTVMTQTSLLPNETGFPNLLTSITTMGDQAWIPNVRAAPDLPNGLTTRVFAAVSVLNITNQTEDMAAYLPLNDQTIFGSPVNNPVAAIPSPDGKNLYIVLAGSDLVEVIDIADPNQPKLKKFVAVGTNPRCMVLNQTGTQGYVMNYLSRSVSVLDLTTIDVTAVITTTAERLAPDVLHGKILFNNAVNPKLSQGSWISCASCHPDGGTDSVTWMFPDGPRQTPPLWNAGQTLPWHWSAALDEPQDVEETIHLIQLGFGLAPGTDPAQLGLPNAGRSADLDALSTFMLQGIRVPIVKGAQEEQLGRMLFMSADCINCHGGENWSDSQLPGLPGGLDPDGNGMVDTVLRDVGTLNPRDLRGATGFDIPALIGIRLTAPYLHDGSASSLEALLRSGHPTPESADNRLQADEIAQLVRFLQTIDLSTTPIAVP